MNSDRIQIEEMLDEIEDIYYFINIEKCHNLNDFLENDMLKKAVMMSIINIEELAKILSKPFKFKHSNVDFDQFREIRNTSAHKYGTINFVLIWNIIRKTLPKFQHQLTEILKR